MKNKKLWVFVVGLVVAVLIGFGIYNRNKNLQYLKAKKGDVLEAIYGLGKVQTDEVFELKIGVMTNVSKLYVKEGDQVSKDQKIISFDTLGSFKAPFAGTVTFAQFKNGEVVSPHVPIIRLENLNKKYIEVSLEQEAALKVRPGQKAKLVFQSLSGGTIEGMVDKVYPKQGEFIAHIEASNIDSHVLPGMTADVVIEVGSKKDVTLIPIKAISSGQVIRKRDGRKKKIPVTTGHSDGIWVELVDGDIQLTDELVVKGK